MRKMKNSGIAWIGDIPENWEVVFLSSVFNQRKSKNKGMIESNLLSLSYGNVKRKSIDTKEGLLPESFEGYNVIEKGDIVFRLTDLQNDKRSLRTGLCLEKGIITSAYVTIHSTVELSSEFMHNLLHSYDICKVFYGLGDGVRQGMNFEDLKKMKILNPPICEQKKIADYLDLKCGNVDELVGLQENMVKELKDYKQSVITEAVTKGLNKSAPMKNSGIDWIGEIPESFSVCKVKNISCKVTDGSHIAPDTTEELNKFVSVTDMDLHGNINFNDCLKITNTQYEYLVKTGCNPLKNDVLISKDGTIGKTTIVHGDVEFVVASSLVIIRPNLEIIKPKFLNYNLMSKGVTFQLNSFLSGTGLKRVSVGKNASLEIVFIRKLQEQQEIADYLDKKCEQIDKLIAIKQQKILELKDYKKSLIYEYVTGKKEVM